MIDEGFEEEEVASDLRNVDDDLTTTLPVDIEIEREDEVCSSFMTKYYNHQGHRPHTQKTGQSQQYLYTHIKIGGVHLTMQIP